jgi:hypothetical protein
MELALGEIRDSAVDVVRQTQGAYKPALVDISFAAEALGDDVCELSTAFVTFQRLLGGSAGCQHGRPDGSAQDFQGRNLVEAAGQKASLQRGPQRVGMALSLREYWPRVQSTALYSRRRS